MSPPDDRSIHFAAYAYSGRTFNSGYTGFRMEQVASAVVEYQLLSLCKHK
ncbi:hypothetical protein AMD24_00107 [Candidatus Xiphinematobacter sp. Idaho Grape]|nr:hypothetical protein AMD24_00107 [Candidatus Xiphinematobacter sp. Idaho Grape]